MNAAARALVIGCAIEAVCALPFVFASAGPCTINSAGLLGLLLHLPGGLLGLGMQALFDVSNLVALGVSVIAHALFWAAVARLVMHVRLTRERRRTDALPTI